MFHRSSETTFWRSCQLLSAIKMFPLGCKFPHLKHVVLFRRQLLMILKENMEILNLAFKFRIDETLITPLMSHPKTWNVSAVGQMGNLISACPERVREGWAPGIDGTVQVLPFVKADSLFFPKIEKWHKQWGQRYNASSVSWVFPQPPPRGTCPHPGVILVWWLLSM